MASLTSNIDILGFSSRLPGAKDSDEFWSLLKNGECAVTSVSPDRWPLARFGHPLQSTSGKTYTWAAGQMDDVWGFDPSFFGISPREAVQMDPQQRLLLQLVWEALEHANIRPSDLAGTSTGVYVGASSLDYHHRFLVDPAMADMQFMTGNTLSIVSNRISYIYDLRGPSFTVDTACSSSIVALHEAVSAIESGQIDTAIVCGVSLLLSPFAFVGFSRATMLSPSGLCQAFDANGDGYVRSEGGAVVILRAARAGLPESSKSHGKLLATGINADGRTVGLSLPSPYAQADLLREIYEGLGIDPSKLAFVEAHGTGTRVGDPAEADALGKVIGQKRSDVLPIGSVKTNVGHLEPVSGLVGFLKSVMALKEDLFPKSLHFETPNPDIPFEELNLKVAGEAIDLQPSKERRFAGVNSFGFGGTNAHAVIGDPDPVAVSETSAPVDAPLVLSARSREALQDLAGRYLKRFDEAGEDAAGNLIASSAHSRDLLSERMVVLGKSRQEKLDALRSFSENGEELPDLVSGSIIKANAKVGFVFSGNGSQWAGMGQEAYQADVAFRDAFDKVDRIFMGLSGWSLVTTLFAEDLESDLERSEIAQPLLFAIQIGIVESLRERGITPSGTTGHSVGEVAAAWCSGALDLEQAVRVIRARSSEQEVVRDLGSMGALLLSADQAVAAIKESGLPRLELAADNSPRSVTISGDSDSLDAFSKFARKKKWAMRRLNLAYPFHSALVDPIKEPLLAALDGLAPGEAKLPFYSTVTPDEKSVSVSNDYWWKNVRQPVLFAAAIENMTADDFSVLVEIGPKPVLGTYVNDVLRAKGKKAKFLETLKEPSKKSAAPAGNPLDRIAASILAHGGKTDLEKYVGPKPAQRSGLPSYPWQNTEYRPESSPEQVDFMFGQTWPLLGYRLRKDTAEWFNHIDSGSLPFLNDHKVEESVVFPAAGYIEMCLRAALRWTRGDQIELRDFDIVRPLVIDGDEVWETQVRISSDDNVIEILSRPRLSDNDWSLNARGTFLTPSTTSRKPWIKAGTETVSVLDHETLYKVTESFGLNYGQAFRRAHRVVKHSDTTATVDLMGQDGSVEKLPFALCPTLVDAGFHGLFALLDGVKGVPQNTSFLPIRLGTLRLLAPETHPASVSIEVTKASPRSIEASFEFLDADGQTVARLNKARFKAVTLGQDTRPDDLIYRQIATVLPYPERISPLEKSFEGIVNLAKRLDLAGSEEQEPDDSRVLIEALGRAICHHTLFGKYGDSPIRLSELVSAGELHETAAPLSASMLAWLSESGLCEETDEGFRLEDPAEHPAAHDLLQALTDGGGEHIAEAALLSRLWTGLTDILTSGLEETPAKVYASSLFDAYRSSSPGKRALSAALQNSARSILETWSKDQAFRVLIVGASGSLAANLDKDLDLTHMALTVTDATSAAVGRGERLWQGSSATTFLEPAEAEFDVSNYFDLVLFDTSLADIDADTLKRFVRSITPGGVVLAAEPLPHPLSDLIMGVGSNWWDEQSSADEPISSQQSDWTKVLESAGLRNIDTIPLKSTLIEADLICARVSAEADAAEAAESEDAAETAPETKAFLLLTDAEGPAHRLAEGLKSCMERHGHAATLLVPGEVTEQLGEGIWSAALELHPDQAPDEELRDEALSKLLAAHGGRLVHLRGAYAKPGDALNSVDDRAYSMMMLLKALGAEEGEFTLLAPAGAQDIAGGKAPAPDQAGIWAFGRVVMNEYPDANLKLIDVSPDLEPGIAAARVAEEILIANCEREIVLDSETRSGLRLLKGGVLSDSALPEGARPAMQLDITRQGSLDQLTWKAVERQELAGKDIEIAVEASGLNFRDVMWALGLLPEEALEDGFAGPTLGMECCGHVVACGPDVTRFKTGDKVITFAPACFASHVTVDESGCAPMPSTVSAEEAATIPVTFLTAFYALVHLADLAEGETVLIHGGAGGVGLAALQIAKWRGAKIIATAGSEDKRNTLKLLGADVVLDSRSLAFVDAVLEETRGDGVDVVLNSLFGEAMERSIEVLKPFGRFLELGKRDYYGNTRIGLRPFRQNLTYFGIDADQLLTRQPKLAVDLFVKLVELFEDGTLRPLPHRVFEADDVVDAFRLMQQAGHIGKIVIRPPQVPASVPAATDIAFDSDAVYVIAGGFGGFGAALLNRLADHGARNLAVLSRRGDASEEAQSVLGQLTERGVHIKGHACDITDENAVKAALSDIRALGKPIKGVFHTAMVLNDVLIANMDHDGLTRVLAPKVRGAELLDRLTADDPLDHFVLYSSATTLVGNPGQANYVAANGYLEGLARRRRADGKPALAVAWGAISDAGYLARNEDVNEMLSRKLGRHALTAKEALDGLMALLALPEQSKDVSLAALGYARIDWQAARKDLALVGTPFVSLLGLGDEDETGSDGAIDLAAMLQGMDQVTAAQTVAKLLAAEIGKILRIAPEEIDSHKPLSDIGMDSLMALELRMSAERQLGIDIPLMSLANGATLIDLSTRVANRVLGEENASGMSDESQQLASLHVDDERSETEDLSDVAAEVESKSRELGSFL
ncbi:type I polyketide synthase [Labrenzia sp. OB1]|uniref:type I polyketide synthase n=1 Tax=Labrenzia sp. OB1 TaxID=1561204 RepID=UPI0007B18B42|nr:type I polyketide synthase [Labrenzia sp. OB1]KZM50189.1 fatty acid synthase transmembrane protein [Labrenzia sp. OB1]